MSGNKENNPSREDIRRLEQEILDLEQERDNVRLNIERLDRLLPQNPRILRIIKQFVAALEEEEVRREQEDNDRNNINTNNNNN